MSQKVSVIIPTYNSAEYITEALDSVFAQTYKNYEVIVIDDGSTDNTKDVLKPYMSRIKYIYKENGGVSSARNVGIKNAEGEYIAFLDSDDIWLPEKLERQIERFNSEPDLGLVYSNCIRFSENGIEQSSRKVKKYLEGDIFAKILEGYVLPTSTVIAKKLCFDEVGYFDERFSVSEDYDMWLRISRFFKIGYVKGPLVKYRIRTSSIIRSTKIDSLFNAKKAVIEKNIEYLDKTFNKEKFLKNRLFRLHFKWGIEFFTKSYYKEAKEHFVKAIKYKPLSFKVIFYYFATLLPDNFVDALRNIKQKLI